jgi:hypothetical protein
MGGRRRGNYSMIPAHVQGCKQGMLVAPRKAEPRGSERHKIGTPYIIRRNHFGLNLRNAMCGTDTLTSNSPSEQ